MLPGVAYQMMQLKEPSPAQQGQGVGEPAPARIVRERPFCSVTPAQGQGGAGRLVPSQSSLGDRPGNQPSICEPPATSSATRLVTSRTLAQYGYSTARPLRDPGDPTEAVVPVIEVRLVGRYSIALVLIKRLAP